MRKLIVVAMLGAAGPAWAQQPPPTLPPVVVEATPVPDPRRETDEQARQELQRVPGGTAVITRPQIEESRAANLKDVLEFTPGVLIRPRFGAADESQLSIRGSGLRNNFHLRGVNLLIDGFRYGQADGFSDFESLELLTTKRIEVYKGANALSLGGDTLGGAINLITKTGYDVGLLELRSEGGSFGFTKNYAGSGGVWGPFDAYGAFTNTELQGFRDHSEQLRRRAYATGGFTLPGGGSVRLDLGYARNKEQLPGSLTRGEFLHNPQQQDPTVARFQQARNYDFTRGGLTVRLPVGEHQIVEWKTQLDYQDLFHPLSFAIIEQSAYNWGTELRHTLSAPLFEHGNRLVTGLQYFSTRQNDRNVQNNSGHPGAATKNQINVATNAAAYGEEQFDVTKAVTAVLGARGQYAVREVRDRFLSAGNHSDSVDFFSITPKAGVVWRVAPTVQVYTNASRAYEPPLMLELTAPGQIGGRLNQLQAQKAWQFELGTRGTATDRLAWDVAVYDYEIRDEIRNVNVVPFFGAPFTIPRYVNTPRSRHLGVEAGADVVVAKDVARTLGAGTGGDRVTLRTAYTFSRFTFVDDRQFGDNDLPGAPRHFIRSEVRYDHTLGFWFAPGIEVVPTGYFVDSANTARTPNYSLVSVRAGYDYKPWNVSVFFEGRNLTNETYVSSVQVDNANRRFFEPGDGRAFYGGVQWRWR